MVKICIILVCAKKIFFGKIICFTHQKKCFSTILGNFWKIEFLKEYQQVRTLQKRYKFVLSQFVLRKYFLAKLFVPLIKGSASPQFYTIFGKLNFWRNIDRRKPYKNGENLYYLNLSKENIFFAKLFIQLIRGSVSPQFYAIFGKLNFWRNIDRPGPYKVVKIWTILNCAKNFFWQNYLFYSSKEEFLHSLR